VRAVPLVARMRKRDRAYYGQNANSLPAFPGFMKYN
jgi:hypothetical protein